MIAVLISLIDKRNLVVCASISLSCEVKSGIKKQAFKKGVSLETVCLLYLALNVSYHIERVCEG